MHLVRVDAFSQRLNCLGLPKNLDSAFKQKYILHVFCYGWKHNHFTWLANLVGRLRSIIYIEFHDMQFGRWWKSAMSCLELENKQLREKFFTRFYQINVPMLLARIKWTMLFKVNYNETQCFFLGFSLRKFVWPHAEYLILTLTFMQMLWQHCCVLVGALAYLLQVKASWLAAL